eukprot:Phypoly_transcript_10585.p1 GENE.Phypoly_transcript_10585~~Phypoly_transcript_10585.p1  ORF type:complete len:329 (+),score=42.55 Phypoly_transcript_10585:179-1165(+)
MLLCIRATTHTFIKRQMTTSLNTITDKDGHFRRPDSSFRNTIAPNTQFPPEKGRYILYANLGCPWANRTLITRELKGLQEIVDLAILDWELTPNGWSFDRRVPEATGDPVYNAKFLKEIYLKVEPDYQGRVTIPVLFDKKTEKIVNNESSEIIRIFNSSFNELLSADTPNFVPDNLKKEIDEINDWVYHSINNGVYKTGFATTQEAYEENVKALFAALERVEKILSDGRKYLLGDAFTEADIRLYPTIARFDVGYHGAFKCNIGMIRHDFPLIQKWYLRLYWEKPAFKKFTNFSQIKKGYYTAVARKAGFKEEVVVPIGPLPDIPQLQ